MIWFGLRLIEQLPLLGNELMTLSSPHPDTFILLDVIAKAIGILFAAILISLIVLRGPARSGTAGFLPKIVAFLGAFFGIILLSQPAQPISVPLQVLSVILIIAGMAFAVYALIWLGRSFSVMPETRSLVMGGPYALVRHPVYLGEEIAMIGLCLQYYSLVALVILILQIGFQLYRMHFEEQVMRNAFPDYADYQKRVKRLLPGLY
jgi:protein-S-isoprenylcysteine O-methyltransferase Ste14